MILDLVKNIFTKKEERYYPPIEELFSRNDIESLSIYLSSNHRHASDYGTNIGTLLHDLRLSGYIFRPEARPNEPTLMVEHVFEHLFSQPNWKFYQDKNYLNLKMRSSAAILCKILYCPEKDLTQFLSSIDTATYAIACWRLSL